MKQASAALCEKVYYPAESPHHGGPQFVVGWAHDRG